MRTYLLIEGTNDLIYLESGEGVQTHPELNQLIKVNTRVKGVEEYEVEWYRVTKVEWEIYHGDDLETDLHCHLLITKIDTRFAQPPER